MKKLIFLLTAIFLFISPVLAEVTETNYFKYGIIQDGILIETNQKLNEVKAIGFVCSSKNCGTVSEKIFDIEYSLADKMTLTYPTLLQSSYGYGVYFFKEGYIPYETISNWYGNGHAGSYNNYLSRKDVCESSIKNVEVKNLSEGLIVKGTITPPLLKSGPLDYIPKEIEKYYESNVLIELIIKKEGEIVYNESKQERLSFENKLFNFDTPINDSGNYTIEIKTNVPDAKCLSYNEIAFQTVFNISYKLPDSNPPVVNLIYPSNLSVLNYSSEPIKFLFSVLDESEIKYCNLNVNGFQVKKTEINNGLNFIDLLLGEGDYNAEVTCKDIHGNTGKSNKVFFTILKKGKEDTTPPAKISNLKVVSKTKNSIKWSWTNPNDTDFARTLIYLNGQNVINLSESENSYNATGLQPNTYYNITIKTIDTSGNINQEGVSSSVKTLADNGGDDNGDDNGESEVIVKKVVKKASAEESPIVFTSKVVSNGKVNYTEDLNGFLSDSTEIETKKITWLPYLLTIIIVLIIILFILIVTSSPT